MAKGKVRLGAVDLFFFLIILHSFLLIKSCMSCLSITYYLSYLNFPIREPLGRFGNCFMHLWGIWLDLASPLLTISNGILMHSNLLCNYLLQQPMTSYSWLLYTYSIQVIVMLQFQSPLCVNLHVWLVILWVQLIYHLGSISTTTDFTSHGWSHFYGLP